MPVTGRETVLPAVGRTFVGGFESTYLPAADVDLLETTGHTARWREDLDRMLDAGVRHLRCPLRWHRIEAEPGRYGWTGTDAVLGHLRAAGAVPIVDLVHQTGHPAWLTDGFRGPAFAPARLRLAGAVATRYPWLPAYTLFNEPSATLLRAGRTGLWPPYDRGVAGFTRLLRSVLPAVGEAAVSSATPFPRAPLLGRTSAALLLHRAAAGRCPTCGVPAPCETARALRW